MDGDERSALAAAAGRKTMNPSSPFRQIEDPMTPVPIPPQVSATEGMARLPDTRLGYWDTGGNGEPVILLHPASGSALIWLLLRFNSVSWRSSKSRAGSVDCRSGFQL